MNDDLRKRISDALDRPGGIEADAGLVELLAGDPAAADYARDLRRVDRLLRRWPAVERSDDAWEALAQRIEQRLDEKLATIADPTRPPAFDADPSGPYPAVVSALAAVPPPPVPDGLRRPGTGRAEPPPSPSPVIPFAAKPQPRTDDRFSIPDLPPRLSRPPMALSPVQLRPEKKSARPWILGAGGATILAAAAAVLLAVVTQQGSEDAVLQSAAPSISREESVGAAQATPMPVTPTMPMLPAADPAEMPGARGGTLGWEPPPAPTAAVSPAPQAPPAQGYYDQGAGGGGATIGGGPTSTGAPGARYLEGADGFGGARARRPAARLAPEVAPTKRAPPRPAGGGDVAEGGPGGGEEAAPSDPRRQNAPDPSPPEEELPATPDRGAIRDAMEAVTPAVRACAEGQGGVARITVTIASSGRVTNAMVTGQFVGTPQGSCMARAVRAARFPRFSEPSMSVTYPFSL